MRHKAAVHELVADGSVLPVSSVSFNQDASCFSIAYERGFRVYNSDPNELWVARDFDEGGLSRAVMLQRTNYLVLVGGGTRPLYPQNKVILWDDSERSQSLTLEFLLPVLNVLITRTRLIVVLLNKVHVYSFSSPPIQLASFDTADNEHGIASCNGNSLAIPASIEGRIQIIDIGEQPKIAALIRAHKAPLRALCMGQGVVASASQTGTIIRLFDIATCQLLHEYRRGLDKADIYSMHFSVQDRLAVLSSKASLHVFEIEGEHNRRHALKGIPVAKKYFNSEWSSVSVQTHENEVGTLAWTGPDTIVVIWHNLATWERFVVSPDSKALALDSVKLLDL